MGSWKFVENYFYKERKEMGSEIKFILLNEFIALFYLWVKFSDTCYRFESV